MHSGSRMLRYLPAAVLLSLLALASPAMAMEPARHSADGGCPPAAEAAGDPATAESAASPAKAPALATPPSSQPPQRRTLSSGGEATRVPLRWHSFVPGMFM